MGVARDLHRRCIYYNYQLLLLDTETGGGGGWETTLNRNMYVALKKKTFRDRYINSSLATQCTVKLITLNYFSLHLLA